MQQEDVFHAYKPLLFVALINGQPGMILYCYGVPAVLLTLEMHDGQIWEIDLIANPDKLQGVPALN